MSEPSSGIIGHRLDCVERAVEKIAEAVQEIAKSTNQLAQLEIRHAETRDGLERAFDEIGRIQTSDKEIDTRLKLIEVEMPGLKETRSWVLRAMLAVLSVVGLAVVGLALVGK